tara:strand:- start:153 stop:323 length:171 start_codon:yes stop_codon:yes gene_type:complete
MYKENKMRVFIKPGLLVKPKKTDDNEYAEKLLSEGWVEEGVVEKKSSKKKAEKKKD